MSLFASQKKFWLASKLSLLIFILLKLRNNLASPMSK